MQMTFEVKIGSGNFYSKALPQCRHTFDLFRVNDLALEVRYRDGQNPMVVDIGDSRPETIRTALERAAELNVELQHSASMV
jgi:hypothetical protein